MYQKKRNPAVQGGAGRVVCNSKNTRFQHKNQHLSFAEINARALPVLSDILRRWLPDGVQRGHEYKAHNPRRDDRKAGSFSINTRTGRWSDFATGDKGGDVISLCAYLFNIRQNEARKRIAEMLGVNSHD